MSTTQKPPPGCATLSPPNSSGPARLTSVQSETCRPATSLGSPNAISSLASEDGRLPSSFTGGLTLDLFGQAPAPASRSASATCGKAAAKAAETAVICGLYSVGSSASVRLQRCMESRLLMQLEKDGGTKRRATWKAMATPAGRSYCQLVPSARSMKESGYSGWPTPAARDGKDISRSNAFPSQRERHSPSMATRWLEAGRSWRVISAAYCLAMGYPSKWNETRLKALETRLSLKSPPRSSSRAKKP